MSLRKIIPVTIVLALVAVVAPLHAQSVRFAVVSDTQGDKPDAVNESVFSRIIDNVLAAEPAVQFVIVTGDLVRGTAGEDAMLEQFATWRQIAQPWYDSNMIGLKVYPIPGNHDQSSITSYDWLWQAAFDELPDNGPDDDTKLTYSFDIGHCHFAMVNTDAPIRPHWVDLDWLEADLAASDADFKFVCGHDPAYPVRRHIGHSLDYWPTHRDQFWKILADYNVSAYFCGHVHTYDHWIKDNVHQIISAITGEFPDYLIVDVDNDDVTVSVYTPAGELHEQYALSDTENVNDVERPALEESFLHEIPCVGFFVGLFTIILCSARSLTPIEGRCRHE